MLLSSPRIPSNGPEASEISLELITYLRGMRAVTVT